MSYRTWLAAAGTAALATGLMAGSALADGPAPAKNVYVETIKPAHTAPARVEHYERPQIANWGGLYIGTNIGWAFTDITGDYVQPIGGIATNHHNADFDAAILGGHAGIQHQYGMFVVGVEAAYSGTGATSDWGSSAAGGTESCLLGNSNRTCQSRFDSLFTIGPRLGIAHENWLFFLSTGFASARIDTRTINTTTGADASLTAHRHDGWYLGGGFERILHDRWVWGLEYQHVWLDSERHFSSLQGGCCVVGSSTRDIHPDADIVRFRLSYKFGRNDHAPAYEPTK